MRYLRLLILNLSFLLFTFWGSLLFGQDNTRAFSFLALGDSYTIGESVAERERWPVQLVGVLREEGIDIKDPQIIAKTGWTTEELREAIAANELHPPYDLVSLLIGVNDQYRGYDIDNYPKNFRYLLEKAIDLAGDTPAKVVVLSIPDYSITPFAREKNPSKIARELENYNSINKSISDSLGVHYVDITPISRDAETDTTLLAPDGLHPSGKMYRLWAEQTLQKILPHLKE